MEYAIKPYCPIRLCYGTCHYTILPYQTVFWNIPLNHTALSDCAIEHAIKPYCPIRLLWNMPLNHTALSDCAMEYAIKPYCPIRLCYGICH